MKSAVTGLRGVRRMDIIVGSSDFIDLTGHTSLGLRRMEQSDVIVDLAGSSDFIHLTLDCETSVYREKNIPIFDRLLIVFAFFIIIL